MTFCTAGFFLSKVNVVDYNKINDSLQSFNLFVNYDLQLPESDYYMNVPNGDNVIPTYFALDSNENVVVHFDDVLVSLDMAAEVFSNDGCFGYKHDLIFKLFID